MKKTGIVVNSIGFGGNERSAVNIAGAIRDISDVTIIIQEDCGNHYGYQGKVINLDTPCSGTKAGKAVNALRRIVRLKKVIRKEQIDTLFIILPVSNPINYLRFGCRKIVSCRDCGDLIKRKEKYVSMTERSDMIVCNSQYQADMLAKAAPGLKQKTIAIYNILDIDRIRQLKDEPVSREASDFMQGHQCIISAGRFAEAKGLNNLLKSFSLLIRKNNGARLILIGDGENRDKVRQLISDLHLEPYILLIGFEENPFRYISRSDVFVLPSFYEGFPNTLVEAMACGTAVAATDCPSGPAEILCGSAQTENTVTRYGALIRPFAEKDSSWDAGDIRAEHEAFADMLERLLSDRDLSESLAANAETRINEFTADKIKSSWAEIL